MHKRQLLRIATLCLGLLMAGSVARAQAPPLDVALDYLRKNVKVLGLTEADLDEFVVTNHYVSAHNGLTHIYLQQQFAGIPVHNGLININITSGGQVLNVGNRFVRNLSEKVNSSVPALTAVGAVAAASDHLGLTITKPLTVLQAALGAQQETRVSDGGVSRESIKAELVYQPLDDGTVRLAWDVEIYTLDAMHWWRIRIDAGTGAFLEQHDQVVNDYFGPPRSGEKDGGEAVREPTVSFRLESPRQNPNSYFVFPFPAESPLHPTGGGTPQSTHTDPADAAASPFGWHDTDGVAGAEFTDTQGNNVDAHADLNGDNVPDPGSRPSGGPTLDFNFPVDLNQEPGTFIPGAVTNLFYWNNIIHDVMYHYGFDEASGNFQEFNYTGQGAGSDGVLADAQDNFDGGARCNANFGTPADGFNPRMQMFTCDNTVPERDGDLDNGVIIHEYAHGISNRLTGGPGTTSCLFNAEQMGEGWSDWYALILTHQPGDTGAQGRSIGTYLIGQQPDGPGIRPRPYSTDFGVNEFTYDNIKTAAVPHGVGHVWATMLWDLTWTFIAGIPQAPGGGDDGTGGGNGYDPDLYNGNGGNNLAMQLVTDALKLQVCGPGFVDGRDAILAADVALTGGLNECAIWHTFARRGLGFSASQGNANSTADGTEAFDLPPSCEDLTITKSASPSPVNDGAVLEYTLTAMARNNPQTNVVITDAVPGSTTYVPGSASDGGSEAGGVVSFPPIPSMNPGEMVTRTFEVQVDVGGENEVLLDDDMESGPGNWTTTHCHDTAQDCLPQDWTLGTTNPHGGTSAWFADDVEIPTDQYLALTTPITLNAFSTLRFWHDFDLETGFDGGVIEISTNGGTTWTDLGPHITQNGYTHTISVFFSSPIAGRPAFSGVSGGYQETVVNLSSFAGQNAQIRFRMATDDSVPDVGWYVDDVRISAEAFISNQACVVSNEWFSTCDTILTTVSFQTIRYVDAASGSDAGGNDCTNPANKCATLLYAISQAKDGDIIDLDPGTYAAPGLIQKKLIIQGQGVVQ